MAQKAPSAGGISATAADGTGCRPYHVRTRFCKCLLGYTFVVARKCQGDIPPQNLESLVPVVV